MRRNRFWLLWLAALLALGAGGAYFWEYRQHPQLYELLEFAALYVACPLALSALALFAYFQGRGRKT